MEKIQSSYNGDSKKLLITIKHKKVSKFTTRSDLPEKTRTIILAEITETEDEESKAIDIFITINESPI
jgi:hypothetical protein